MHLMSVLSVVRKRNLKSICLNFLIYYQTKLYVVAVEVEWCRITSCCVIRSVCGGMDRWVLAMTASYCMSVSCCFMWALIPCDRPCGRHVELYNTVMKNRIICLMYSMSSCYWNQIIKSFSVMFWFIFRLIDLSSIRHLYVFFKTEKVDINRKSGKENLALLEDQLAIENQVIHTEM